MTAALIVLAAVVIVAVTLYVLREYGPDDPEPWEPPPPHWDGGNR